MTATMKRPPTTLNLRIPAELFDEFQQVAQLRYEGHLSMTARAALRRYIAQELAVGAEQSSTRRDIAEQEEAA